MWIVFRCWPLFIIRPVVSSSKMALCFLCFRRRNLMSGTVKQDGEDTVEKINHSSQSVGHGGVHSWSIRSNSIQRPKNISAYHVHTQFTTSTSRLISIELDAWWPFPHNWVFFSPHVVYSSGVFFLLVLNVYNKQINAKYVSYIQFSFVCIFSLYFVTRD